VRIALGIEYDGTAFSGWQSQAHGNTVQDAVEHALSKIAGAEIRIACAGRTDAGVHALEQIVHFDTTAKRPDSAWIRGVNANLPPQIAVRWAMPVANDFHARFCAISRSYRYLLLNRPVRPAMQHGRVGWFHLPLDVDAMRNGARLLLGEHDFSAFRAAECQARSPIKQLHRADIAREGDMLLFDFRASAFLHHMVRNFVGTLIAVGKGKQSPEWVGELLVSRDRTRAAATFDPAGLYFVGVDYPPEWGLPPSRGGIIRP